LGYLCIAKDEFSGIRKWWWSFVWKFHAPLKVQVFMWLSLENKILMWDNGIRRGWISSNRCSLCKVEQEMILHLLVNCSYVQKVWNIVSKKLKINSHALLGDLEDWLKIWKGDHVRRELGSLPLFFLYFICWSCNLCIFHKNFIPPEVVAGMVSKISYEFKSEHKIHKQRKPIMPPLTKGVPSSYFDGASQGHPLRCGVRVVLYISESHIFKVRYGAGNGSNAKEEFSAMWALLILENI
jgi:hypothetical protein